MGVGERRLLGGASGAGGGARKVRGGRGRLGWPPRTVKGWGGRGGCGRAGELSPAPGLVVSRSLSAMGAVWSALLVGGALAGALILWLLRSGAPGKDGVAEPPQKGAPPGEAAAPGGDPGGGGSGGQSPEPSDRELVSKAGILPPLELVVLKFPGEGEAKGTWSRAGGFWWTSFPDLGLKLLQPSSRSGVVLSWRGHAGPPEAAPSFCRLSGHRLLHLAALGAVHEAGLGGIS